MFDNIDDIGTKDDLSVISAEAFSNPFDGLTRVIKQSFSAVVNKSTDVMYRAFGSKSDHVLAFKKGPISQIIPINGLDEKNTLLAVPYVDMRRVNVPVTMGFIGNYYDYAVFLTEAMQQYEKFKSDVIVPTNNLVLKYISKPDSINNIGPSDLKLIKFHHDQIEAFKAGMLKFFESKRRTESRPYTKLIRNQEEYVKLVNYIVDNTASTYWSLISDRAELNKETAKLSKNIDVLMMKLEKNEFNINRIGVERFANVVNDVAREIEYLAALQVYVDQFILSFVELQKFIKKLTQED